MNSNPLKLTLTLLFSPTPVASTTKPRLQDSSMKLRSISQARGVTKPRSSQFVSRACAKWHSPVSQYVVHSTLT